VDPCIGLSVTWTSNWKCFHCLLTGSDSDFELVESALPLLTMLSGHQVTDLTPVLDDYNVIG
jgi:hypothetical protein